VLVAALAVMWIVEIVDSVVLDDALQGQGITPRTWRGLDGVLWAPFLHGSYGHLISNTVPFLVLGGLVMLRGIRTWVAVTAIVAVVGGLATWVFARSATHIGASILIFGYFAFLVIVGFVERSVKGIAIGLVAGLLYGGSLVWGLLPISSGVSWEGHLFGALAGVVAALAVGRSAAGPVPTG
jgi:membrane associated rhomboid family serine protease